MARAITYLGIPVALDTEAVERSFRLLTGYPARSTGAVDSRLGRPPNRGGTGYLREGCWAVRELEDVEPVVKVSRRTVVS